ncbi:MAG: sodium-translocating pyrophosphatase [Deltaproteobacteria bacterium]|nr:MAG: sodium-translocating pyrophosphatase [Deltaproteobacteria bacterium]
MKLCFLVLSMVFVVILYSIFLMYKILKAPSGSEKMEMIHLAIKEGASAYIARQYFSIFIIGVILSVFLWILLGVYVCIGFVIGAVMSSLVGYLSMQVSIRANVKTAQAATLGYQSAFNMACDTGAIIGLLVISTGVLSVTSYYFFLEKIQCSKEVIHQALMSLGFGASLISIFARLGGGIFTKGADIGADLVGKIELSIPEDDPRNPAVIADNVGDNVGDCSGMAADLFESYIVTIVGSMILIDIGDSSVAKTLIYLPIIIGGSCMFATMIGTFFTGLNKKYEILKSLYRSFLVSNILSMFFILIIVYFYVGWTEAYKIYGMSILGKNIFYCCLSGLLTTRILMFLTEYYTSKYYRPVKSIAEASVTGHGTNIIQGLAISMESTASPIIIICLCIVFSYVNAGLFGISMAAVSMLSMVGSIVMLDAYGPVTDNAGGIAEMAGMKRETRTITDALDSVGNTTKAITKGYAIGSAGLGSLVLFSDYIGHVQQMYPQYLFNFSLQDPFVIVGLLLGGVITYLFGSMCLLSVGRAAQIVVFEVRRQFSVNAELLTGKGRPDYAYLVDLLTQRAIKEMIYPGLLPVLMPIIIYFLFLFVGEYEALIVLGSMLLGLIISGVFVAISMTSGGGAWDNAKKYIEEGHFGGKGTDTHKASITGDTVGDPYKDTAGPAINPMIKIANIVALLLISILHISK